MLGVVSQVRVISDGDIVFNNDLAVCRVAAWNLREQNWTFRVRSKEASLTTPRFQIAAVLRTRGWESAHAVVAAPLALCVCLQTVKFSCFILRLSKHFHEFWMNVTLLYCDDPRWQLNSDLSCYWKYSLLSVWKVNFLVSLLSTCVFKARGLWNKAFWGYACSLMRLSKHWDKLLIRVITHRLISSHWTNHVQNHKTVFRR